MTGLSWLIPNTCPFTRFAISATIGESKFNTVQSPNSWLRKIFSFASWYRSMVLWRNKWSGVTFSKIAPLVRNLSILSNW